MYEENKSSTTCFEKTPFFIKSIKDYYHHEDRSKSGFSRHTGSVYFLQLMKKEDLTPVLSNVFHSRHFLRKEMGNGQGWVVGLRSIFRIWDLGLRGECPQWGVFLRDPSLYLRKFRRKTWKNPTDLLPPAPPHTHQKEIKKTRSLQYRI